MHVADVEIKKNGQVLEEFICAKSSNYSNIYAEIVKIRKALKGIYSVIQSNAVNGSHISHRMKPIMPLKIKKVIYFYIHSRVKL